MIIDYQRTNTAHIADELNRLRGEGGVMTLGRVLTLVIVTQRGQENKAIAAAIAASREHPCRIIVLAPADRENDKLNDTYMNAQVRLGSDSGTGEVIVIYSSGALREPTESLISPLILPDIPIVVWWHIGVPENTAATSLGMIAHRRITDTSQCNDTTGVLNLLNKSYVKGNTDIAWTRTTYWRTQLVAALEQVKDPDVQSILVEGSSNSSSILLLASWLHQRLKAPLTVIENPKYQGIHRVVLSLPKDAVNLTRVDAKQAVLTQPGHLLQHVSLSQRTLEDCLDEELRHLDEDKVYGSVITEGFPQSLESMTLKTK